VNRGVCVVEDSYLVNSTETLKIEKTVDGIRYPQGDTWVSLNPETPVAMLKYGVDPSLFSVLEKKFHEFAAVNIDDPKAEFHFPNVLGEGMSNGTHRSKVLINNDTWSGVSYKADKEQVQARLKGLTND
jgi:hypothetical protein